MENYNYKISISDGYKEETIDFVSECGLYSIKDLFDKIVYGTDLHVKTDKPADRPEGEDYRTKYESLRSQIGEVAFRMKTANKEHSQYQMYMDILVGDLDKLAKGE